MGFGGGNAVFETVSSEGQEPELSQAAIAAIGGLIPTIFITRVRL